MANKLVIALKENKNEIRKKLVIATVVTGAAIAAGIVAVKMAKQTDGELYNVLSSTDDGVLTVAPAATE